MKNIISTFLGFISIFFAFYISPFFSLFLAFGLLSLIADYNKKSDLLYIYLYFIFYNLISTYWLAKVQISEGILTWFVNSLLMLVTVIPSLLLIDKSKSRLRVLVFISCWMLFEFLHHTWSYNWPWLTIGNIFCTVPQYVQWYKYTGVFGGTLWVLLINYLLVFSIKKNRWQKYYLTGLLAIIIIPPIISKIIYNNSQPKYNAYTSIYIVQPDANSLKEKINEFKLIDSVFSKVEILDSSKPATIILTETFLKELTFSNKIEDNRSVQRIQWYLKKHPNLNCISGLLINEINVNNNGRRFSKYSDASYDMYDAAVCLSSNAAYQLHYKSNLIPIEEYMPSYFRGLGFYSDNFSKGNDYNAFQITDSFSIAIGICFETLFTNSVANMCNNKNVGMIGMIANEQMLSGETEKKVYTNICRLRAIENGMYLVKSSNLGFTGVINEKGDILKSMSENQFGVSQELIPFIKEKTFYTKYFEVINFVIVLQSIMFLLVLLLLKIWNYYSTPSSKYIASE